MLKSESIKKIGNYKEMLKIKPNPLTHGNLFFYRKAKI